MNRDRVFNYHHSVKQLYRVVRICPTRVVFTLQSFAEFVVAAGELSKADARVKEFIQGVPIKTVILNIGRTDAVLYKPESSGVSETVARMIKNLEMYDFRFKTSELTIRNVSPYVFMNKLSIADEFNDPYVKPVKINVALFQHFPALTSVAAHDVEFVAYDFRDVPRLAIQNISLCKPIPDDITPSVLNSHVHRVFIKYSGVVHLDALKTAFPCLERVYIKSIARDCHVNGVQIKQMKSFQQIQYELNVMEMRSSRRQY